MQRRWVLATLLASGLLAQTPPPEPPPAPAQAPAVEIKPPEPAAEAAPAVQAPVPALPEEKPALEAKPFDQLRPSQRKLAYTVQRAALSAHELGLYRSHPRVIEIREALKAFQDAKLFLPAKHQAVLTAVDAYLASLRAQHGLYDAEGKKLLLATSWKELRDATRAMAKTGPKGLESRLLRLKGLLLDPKVDATAPSWAEPEPAAKGKKAKARKGPKAPDGFSEQKAITALWVKRTQAWIENTPQEVEIKGEKKTRRLPDPVQTKALADLAAWLEKDDLDLLRDPGFGWLDLRRLGATPGTSLMAHVTDITAGKAPEGAAGELTLLPSLEPVLGDSKFSKGDEKRVILAEVKLGPAPADLATQMAAFELLGRSRELAPK